jgi:hypothetical protein
MVRRRDRGERRGSADSRHSWDRDGTAGVDPEETLITAPPGEPLRRTRTIRSRVAGGNDVRVTEIWNPGGGLRRRLSGRTRLGLGRLRDELGHALAVKRGDRWRVLPTPIQRQIAFVGEQPR